MSETILQVEHLTKKFPVAGGNFLTACDDINFSVCKGEIVAMVGESGCGKSTLLNLIMNFLTPTSGKIIFHGKDTSQFTNEEKRQNYKNIQMIFQDTSAAFNPKMKVKDVICESLLNFGLISKSEVEKKSVELLEQVELPTDFMNRYPHNMSGGQRQRVATAAALAINPEIILCDEATSALYVSVQDKIIRLFAKLRREKGTSYIFVTHDIALAGKFAEKICVMYLGNIVEEIDGDKFENARHPYTNALLKSIFSIDAEKNQKIEILQGDIPSPSNIPKGCPFQNRCKYCEELCRKKKPDFRKIGQNHFIACHYPA